MNTEQIRRGIMRGSALTDDTKLYRYIGLSQFMSLVEKGQTYLTRIQTWDDTWEVPIGRVPHYIRKDDGTLSKSQWSIYDILFGQCWSLQSESDALWRIYSPVSEGLIIETTVKQFDLLSDIQHALLSPVRYSDCIDDFCTTVNSHNYPLEDVFNSALIKRKAFGHEHEVRLITLNDERCLAKECRGVDHIPIACNPREFINSITIHPKASEWYVDTIVRYCKRAAFQYEPRQSNLYIDFYRATGLSIHYVPVDKDNVDSDTEKA